MSEALNINTIIETDPLLIRPNENKKVTGSYKKINEELGWRPQISLEQSIQDLLTYWQKKLIAG